MVLSRLMVSNCQGELGSWSGVTMAMDFGKREHRGALCRSGLLRPLSEASDGTRRAIDDGEMCTIPLELLERGVNSDESDSRRQGQRRLRLYSAHYQDQVTKYLFKDN